MNLFYKLKAWFDRVTGRDSISSKNFRTRDRIIGRDIISPLDFIGKYPVRKDVEVIPPSEPFEGWDIKVLSDSDPIEEYDDCAGQFKGTTKIDNTIWGVLEIDPTEFQCNGKWMTKEEMSQALWADFWYLESERMGIRGRRHIASYIVNKRILDKIDL